MEAGSKLRTTIAAAAITVNLAVSFLWAAGALWFVLFEQCDWASLLLLAITGVPPVVAAVCIWWPERS